MDEIQLGDIAKDDLTGFEGIVTGRTHWLSNCDRLTIQPLTLDKDGQPQKTNCFDITHCVLLKKSDKTYPSLQADMRPEIALGDTARDEITGFEGVVIARAHWLSNCDRLVLQPKGLKDGQPHAQQGFDASHCTLVSKLQPPAPKEHRGGPMPDVSRHSDPAR